MHTQYDPSADVQFRLSNEARRYFGLDPIEKHWEEVQVIPGFFVYYDGDCIMKIIEVRNIMGLQYWETDNKVRTRNRTLILPRTSRGKEKNLTPARLNKILPTGCKFQAGFSEGPHGGSGISVENPRNSKRLPITNASNIRSLAQLRHWIANYISTCPADYFDKVNKLKNSPHVTVKYQAGDVFRFELDQINYGFGLILGEIRKWQRDDILPAGHPMHTLWNVPILVRLYLLKSNNKDLPIEEIARQHLLPSIIVADGPIIWGSCDIVGSKDLIETDIELPIHICTWTLEGETVARLYWGPASAETDRVAELESLLGRDHLFAYNGVGCGMPTYLIDEFYQENPEHLALGDIRDRRNRALHEQVFQLFGLSPDISYDEFNREYEGMSRSELAQYINRSRQGPK